MFDHIFLTWDIKTMSADFALKHREFIVFVICFYEYICLASIQIFVILVFLYFFVEEVGILQI